MRALDDTIAAISTAPGTAGVAVVRVSGPGAGPIGTRLLRRRDGSAFALVPGTVRWARLVEGGGRTLDELLALWMPGPRSYTREDVLELQCHGGQAAAHAVLQAVLAAGARLADPGEFTLRAFVRGRLDLVQAEAVLDAVQARTTEALRVHEALLEGTLSEEVGSWQQALGEALALLEADLDFPEEELGKLDREALRGRLGAVAGAMDEKLGTFAWGRVTREGFRIALVGAPNTGKSSLLNRLAGEERAIVSALPGTTRDAIEVPLNACGVPVRVTDTAGLRASDDEVEAEGVRRARRAADEADLVVLVCDGSRPLATEEEAEARRLGPERLLPVVNKVDLGRLPSDRLQEVAGRATLEVSANTGEGIEDLLQAFRREAWGTGARDLEAPLTRLRHRHAVEGARRCVGEAAALLEREAYPELAAAELHAARRALSELLGWGTPEDVLDRVFSEFCIGK